MRDRVGCFEESIDLKNHPINRAKEKTKIQYLEALTFATQKFLSEASWQLEKTYVSQESITPLLGCLKEVLNKKFFAEKFRERLDIYQQYFLKTPMPSYDAKKAEQCFKDFFTTPYRKKYAYALYCDMALMVGKPFFVQKIFSCLNPFITPKSQCTTKELLDVLLGKISVRKTFSSIEPWIYSTRENICFLEQPEKRYLVTANMSAGKSTLINALIGKPVARMAQGVCTGNICYLKNKTFEDGYTHIYTNTLKLNASNIDLNSYAWDSSIYIATRFMGLQPITNRICFIDTPGVDAAQYKEHVQLTHDAFLKEEYETVLYVISPTKLGTDAEKKHLQWVRSHMRQEKIIFILNKADNYKTQYDNLEESMKILKVELEAIGFSKPVICPISAYFSLLIKRKIAGQALSEDEKDEYQYFVRKFQKPVYNLARFYPPEEKSESEYIEISKTAGLFGLEKIIFGVES